MNCTVRNINLLVKDHIIPAPDKNHKYDWLACNHAYITHLKSKSLLSKSKVDEEIKQIELESRKFKHEQNKGLYILKSEVAEELTKRITILKRDFKVLENRLSKYPEAREIVKKTHYGMMTIYSKRTGTLRGKK